MSYTLADVRQAVRNRLDDLDFEDEYLTRAINYAQWDITNNHRLTLLEASTTFSVLVGEISHTLPTDFRMYSNLIITSPTSVRQDISGNFKDYDDFITTYIDPSANPSSMPYNWTEYGRSILFSSPADQAYSLKLNYQKIAPQLVNDSDVPTIPQEFEELLEIGTYLRIVKREDDYDVRDAELIDYSRLLNEFIAAYSRKKGPGGLRRMRTR